MNVVKKIYLPIISTINNYKPTITTSLNVKMANPFDKDRKWIGWNDTDVSNHLRAVRLSLDKK